MATKSVSLEAQQPTVRIFGFYKNLKTGKRWTKECNDEFPFVRLVLEADIPTEVAKMPLKTTSNPDIVMKLIDVPTDAIQEYGGKIHIFSAVEHVDSAPDVF